MTLFFLGIMATGAYLSRNDLVAPERVDIISEATEDDLDTEEYPPLF